MAASQEIATFCKSACRRGAKDAVVISPRKMVTAAWVRLRCQYGCSEYGQCLTCPPYSPTPEMTRKVLDEYQTAILLHGKEGRALRKIACALELEIFLAGYYKAFAFPCGPCWMCKTCGAVRRRGGVAECKHPDLARPSMEAAGIDVYATARRRRAADRSRHVRRLPARLLRLGAGPVASFGANVRQGQQSHTGRTIEVLRQ